MLSQSGQRCVQMCHVQICAIDGPWICLNIRQQCVMHALNAFWENFSPFWNSLITQTKCARWCALHTLSGMSCRFSHERSLGNLFCFSPPRIHRCRAEQCLTRNDRSLLMTRFFFFKEKKVNGPGFQHTLPPEISGQRSCEGAERKVSPRNFTHSIVHTPWSRILWCIHLVSLACSDGKFGRVLLFTVTVAVWPVRATAENFSQKIKLKNSGPQWVENGESVNYEIFVQFYPFKFEIRSITNS